MWTSIELREEFESKAADHVQPNQLSVFVKRLLRPSSWAKAIHWPISLALVSFHSRGCVLILGSDAIDDAWCDFEPEA